MSGCTLVVFARLPVPGKTKTRLAASLGPDSACNFYKVVIIGTDIPDISGGIISKAFRVLDSHQVVVGPAIDGGFYLLGLTSVTMELFQGVEWSTSSVRQRTLDNALRLGWSVAPPDTLPTLQDIDVLQDLQAWAAEAQGRVAGQPGCCHPILDTVSDLLSAAPKK